MRNRIGLAGQLADCPSTPPDNCAMVIAAKSKFESSSPSNRASRPPLVRQSNNSYKKYNVDKLGVPQEESEEISA